MSFSLVFALGAVGLLGLAALALWPGLRARALVLMAAYPLLGGRRAPGLAAPCVPRRRWWGVRGGRPSAPPSAAQAAPGRSAERARLAVMGYATFPDHPGEESDEEELAKQADVIARACERRGL